MEIHPSDAEWIDVKNWTHFYIILTAVPLAVGITIINIRANPVLSEVPEGYEPRHWEYHKHPIARFLAKHFFVPMEREHEVAIGACETSSESHILRKIGMKVDKAMMFYADHRARYFKPMFGESYRVNRDEAQFGFGLSLTNYNSYYDDAFNPDINPVPTEGFPDGPFEK